jgi:hypothetical protein
VKDYLFEVGGTLNVTHDLLVDYDINLPSQAAWKAAFSPQFDSTGRPVDILPGNVDVANPFKGNSLFLSTLGTANNVKAYQLARPNPMYGDLKENRPIGKSTYYALQAKAERRLKNGFSLLQSFTWSKKMNESGFLDTDNLNPITYQSLGLDRQLAGDDREIRVKAYVEYYADRGGNQDTEQNGALDPPVHQRRGQNEAKHRE